MCCWDIATENNNLKKLQLPSNQWSGAPIGTEYHGWWVMSPLSPPARQLQMDFNKPRHIQVAWLLLLLKRPHCYGQYGEWLPPLPLRMVMTAACWCWLVSFSSHLSLSFLSGILPLCTIIFCCIITLQYTIIMLIQPLINSSGSLGAFSIRSTPLQNPSVSVCSFQLLSVGVSSLPLLFLCPLPYVILQAFTFGCCLLSTWTLSVNFLNSFSQQELV